MKCLYKVPFSGFFMAYAESAEEAKKMSPDDGEVIYSEQSTGEIEACPDGASILIDEHHCLFIEPADEDFDEGISEDWEDEL